MSKPINLLSLVQAKGSLSDAVFENFKRHHRLEFRSSEVDDLASLIKSLTESGCSISDFDNFIVGYKIPQIGKEFDLLRVGGKFIINIELKSVSGEEKIEKQLTRNNYYLSFAGLETYHYTYSSKSGSLFKLSRPGEIERVEIKELATLLQEQGSSQEDNIDELFHPTNYLVSPFNSTEQFLAGKYFLTQQQENAFETITESLSTHIGSGFISLTGGAGTGKSLLAYHTAKKAFETGKKVLIIHCGMLNQGHEKLALNGWEIMPIVKYESCKISDYDLVIIDEAQRLYESQFKYLSIEIKASKALCIFSFDKLQTLATKEDQLNIELQVSMLNPISSHTLSEKIRSNKEIAGFITMLFNKNNNDEISEGKNIFLKYFSNDEDARKYLEGLNGDEWQLLRFTPSRFDAEHHERYFKQNDAPTSHKIIGQEFDSVVIVIDELFSYRINGQLAYGGKSYYSARKMLFQNITRARKKLLVVIINNEELLERCVAILR